MGVVLHHRPKHHFVVAALHAAHAAAHPRLHEHGDALEIPARRGEAWHREVAVDQRFWMLRLRRDLPEKESAPTPILLGPDVVGGDVDLLMVHQREHALARRERLEGVRQRRDVEKEPAMRRGQRGGRSVVREVFQQDDRGFGRCPPEHPLLPLARVGERPDGVRDEIIERVEVDELEILRFDVGHPERILLGRCGERGDRQQQHAQIPPHSSSSPS
jgi:hypothetical protein